MYPSREHLITLRNSMQAPNQEHSKHNTTCRSYLTIQQIKAHIFSGNVIRLVKEKMQIISSHSTNHVRHRSWDCNAS